jgi:D-glycero-D-manno-heptose 1,7-bisphosphate phosphatase
LGRLGNHVSTVSDLYRSRNYGNLSCAGHGQASSEGNRAQRGSWAALCVSVCVLCGIRCARPLIRKRRCIKAPGDVALESETRNIKPVLTRSQLSGVCCDDARNQWSPRSSVRTMRGVFLDRDGVINVNRSDHVKNWEEFEFLPGAVEAIVRLSNAGLAPFVITNQAIVNRGMVSRELVEWINLRMQRAVERRGGQIKAVAFCPHRPEERCGCRKPEPGLLMSLARSFDVDLNSSVVIGDALSDIEAGQAAGCSTILVLTGRGRDQLALAHATGRNGFVVAPDLTAATEMILRSMAVTA